MSAIRPRTIARPLALAAGALVALSGCGLLGPGAVESSEVEQKISDLFTEQVGQAPDEVDCPDDLKAEEGAEMICALTLEGESMDVKVTATSVDGDSVNFDIEPIDDTE